MANLLEKYYIFKDDMYLSDESMIKEYFLENGADFFDCEDGFAGKTEKFLCKVKNQLYLIELHASFVSEYIGRENEKKTFVDKITKVNYEKFQI